MVDRIRHSPVEMPKAPESKQVEKARQKIKDQIQRERHLVTEEAINKASGKLKDWITRHSQERVKLKGKYSLFDKNEPAKVHSRYVKHLLQDLAKPIPPHEEQDLSGRVTKDF